MKIILSLLFLHLYFSIQHTFLLQGNLRDTNGHVVSNVQVSVMDENYQLIRTILVDSTGRFQVRGLRAGVYQIRIETTGTLYEEQSQRLELLSGRPGGGRLDEIYPIEFILKFKRGKAPTAASGTVFAQTVPKEAREEYERAVKSLKSNKAEQAKASLKTALTIFPDYYDALELLGVEYVKGGQHSEALPVLTHALEVNKSGARSLYGIGVAYLNLNRLAEAVERLEACVQLNPSNPNTYMMLGLAYGNSRQFAKAETFFNKALQIGGEDAAEAHFYLAGLYNKQGQYRKAWQALESFLRKAKNIKDPAQIKAMIEKLKEKEKTKAPIESVPEEAISAVSQAAASTQSTPANTAATIAASTSNTAITATVELPLTAATPPPPEAKLVEPPPVPPLSPEIAALLKQSQTAGGAMHKQLLDYTYQLKKNRRVLDETGKATNLQEQVFEAYPVRGEHILIRLSTDGQESKTLSADRKRAAKELAESEAEHKQVAESEGHDYVSAGISGSYKGTVGNVTINPSAFLQFCEFYAPQEETLANRTTLKLSFRPRFGLALPHNYSYLAKLVGAIWIDQQDQIVTRVEAWPSSAFEIISSMATDKEAAVIYQQERQTNGTWFPHVIRMNARGRGELFNGLNWDVVFEFDNYRRFDAVGTEKIITPASKPH